jgi:hypothetical protein
MSNWFFLQQLEGKTNNYTSERGTYRVYIRHWSKTSGIEVSD